jgi:electron transport complex protein RnfG
MTGTAAARVENPASSFKMLRTMVGLGVLCALMIVLTYEGTFDRIAKNKAEALERAIYQVLPGAVEKQAFAVTGDNTLTRVDGEVKDGQIIYAGYDEKGQLIGTAIEASGMGYADVIRILYGYDPDEEAVIGFYVLESKETPGLGDKIEKDENFLANFEALDVSLTDDGQSMANPVETVKSGEKTNPWEVDGITGATISSRAIGDILKKSSADIIPIISANLDKIKSGNAGG